MQDRTGETPAALASKTQEFIAAVRKRPEIGNAVTLYSASVPQIFANIDRDKVMTLGLQLQDVNTTIGAFLGGQYINDFNRFGRLYKVYVQAEPQYRATPDQLQFFYVRNAKGEMVPLSTFVHASRTNGPEYTNRFNLYRAAEVTGGPAPGYSSAQALQALKEVGDSVLVPAGFGYQFNAMSYQEEAAAGKGAVVFGMALVFVFLILAAQYESWSLPFSVLLGTPFAVFGAFLGLWLARLISPSYENNVFAQIGLVMLIGLAAKNAILDRGIRSSEAARGNGVHPRCDGSREVALPADPDDRVRVHPWRRAAAHGERRRRGGAKGDGHGRVQRHAHRDDLRRAARAGAVRAHREAQWWEEEGTSRRSGGAGLGRSLGCVA